MVMSKKIQECLTKAGWFPGRKVDIAEYVEYYEEEGYEINDLLRLFLEEFGGLKVVYPHFRKDNHTQYMVINPIDEDFPEWYEIGTGEKLVPIGTDSDGRMVLIMSHTGKVYTGRDEFLAKMGDNWYDAIEAYCKREIGEVIPYTKK